MGGGLRSSVFPLISFSTASGIAVDTDILPSDIVATKDSLGGDAGTYRVFFVINSAADADFIFKAIRTNANDTITTAREELLNADLEFISKSKGYYRFDIDVIPGDNINFQVETTAITSVPKLRVQQIQIGA